MMCATALRPKQGRVALHERVQMPFRSRYSQMLSISPGGQPCMVDR